jgi:hypothetical protein
MNRTGGLLSLSMEVRCFGICRRLCEKFLWIDHVEVKQGLNKSDDITIYGEGERPTFRIKMNRSCDRSCIATAQHGPLTSSHTLPTSIVLEVINGGPYGCSRFYGDRQHH